jgi:hypothetical protein
MMILKMKYCESCGACCFEDCKSNDGKCHVIYKPTVCNPYPIMNVGNEYFIGICKGIIDEKVPLNALENIVKRLNLGEDNFKVKFSDFYFSIKKK